MPLPIAHSCIGASIATALGPASSAKTGFRLQAIAAILAIIPDLDFFLVWVLRMGAGWHRGFAHSIIFSAVVALMAALLFRPAWQRVFPALCGAIASHSLLDVLTSRLAPGAELFWPFSSTRYAAGLVDYLDFSIRVRSPFEFVALILRVSLIEAIIFVPLFLAIRFMANRVRANAAVKLQS